MSRTSGARTVGEPAVHGADPDAGRARDLIKGRVEVILIQ